MNRLLGDNKTKSIYRIIKDIHIKEDFWKGDRNYCLEKSICTK